MSVGAIKKVLLLANLAALALLAMVAWSFLGHRSAMKGTAKRPVFAPEAVVGEGERIGAIDNVTMKLGRFPEPVAATSEGPVEEAKPDIESVLERYGMIVAAIVVYPPYTDDGLKPVLIFELKSPAGTRVSVALNEALMSKPDPNPDPAFAMEKVPVAYQFVGCELDAEQRTWFRFDMQCDGKDIQRLRWRGDAPRPSEEKKDVESGAPRPKGFYVGAPAKPRGKPDPEGEKPAETEPVEAPLPPVTPPIPVVPTLGVPDRLFDDENGTLAPTREAVDYLKENYNDLLKDARTQTYVDPTTRQARGIHVMGIKSGSMANKFGVLADDVILSINGRPVTKQAEAVNIVKNELNNNKKIIQVKILRRGREITQTYDTQDPDTRRNARDLLRKRGR